MRLSRLQAFHAVLIVTTALSLIAAAGAEKFVVRSTVEPQSARPGDTVTLHVEFKLAEGVHLYKEKLTFTWDELEGAVAGKPTLPPGGTIPDALDETGQSVIEVYDDAVTVSVSLTITAAAGETAIVHGALKYQGCTDTLCFPPMKEQLSFTIPVSTRPETAGTELLQPEPTPPGAPGQEPSDAGFFLRILIAFGVGILISLTPCVYPLIPVTAAIVAGSQKEGESNLANAVARSVTYVLGLSIVYATLGMLSASLGGAFSRWLKTAWVLVPVAAIFVLLALSMFEVITIQMPGFITRRVSGKRSGKSLGGVFVLGLVAGVVATPCIAAPLAGMLTFIATTGNRLLGFWMLFALAWGMGLILIVVGTVSSSALPKAGPWTLWIKRLFGFIMLWAAAYFLQPVIGVQAYRISTAVVIVAATVFLGMLDALSEKSGFADRLKQTVGILAIIFAALLLVDSSGVLRDRYGEMHMGAGDVEGSPFVSADSAALDRALASGRPTVVEFYAEWCTQCKKLESRTLSAAALREVLSGMNTLRVDYDRHPALQLKYDVIGVPTVLFFDTRGREMPNVRITGFVGPDEMLAAIEQARAGHVPFKQSLQTDDLIMHYPKTERSSEPNLMNTNVASRYGPIIPGVRLRDAGRPYDGRLVAPRQAVAEFAGRETSGFRRSEVPLDVPRWPHAARTHMPSNRRNVVSQEG